MLGFALLDSAYLSRGRALGQAPPHKARPQAHLAERALITGSLMRLGEAHARPRVPAPGPRGDRPHRDRAKPPGRLRDRLPLTASR